MLDSAVQLSKIRLTTQATQQPVPAPTHNKVREVQFENTSGGSAVSLLAGTDLPRQHREIIFFITLKNKVCHL
jgi:hypothetical protein